MKEEVTSWFKDHGFKLVLVIVTSAFTLGMTYGLMNDDIQELNQRVHNLNQRVQSQNNNWAELIKNLDKRYVNQVQFEDFRDRVAVQLQYIREDTQYMRERIDQR